MYRKGDTVFHPHHGVGTVKSIQERRILGYKTRLATLHFDRENFNLLVPPAHLERLVRKPLNSQEAKAVLTYLEEWDVDLNPQWKQRRAANEERMRSGDPYELCQTVKELYQMRKQSRRLGSHDSSQLQRSVTVLADELASALGKSQLEMTEHIEELCQAAAA